MVTSIQDFKAAKTAKAKPLISRNRAVMTAGALVTALADCERNDLMATMRFDLTPDDITAIECFTFHLRERIQDRKDGYQRREGTEDQSVS